MVAASLGVFADGDVKSYRVSAKMRAPFSWLGLVGHGFSRCSEGT